MNTKNSIYLHYINLCAHHRFFSPLFLLLFSASILGVKAQQVGIHGDVFVDSKATLAIYSPETHFFSGIIEQSENNPGRVSFVANAHGVNPHNDSYVETDVLSHDHTSFIFPVGDTGVYQPLQITEGSDGDLLVHFKLLGHSIREVSPPINELSNQFYWSVEGNKRARLSLSWNADSNLSQLTEEVADLLVVGLNGTRWEVIPARLEPFSFDGNNIPTTLNEGAISTTEIVDFSQYSAVTLAALSIVRDIEISQAITPNGDGINDIWYIKDINRFPAAIINVYNRWGARVFQQSGNYNNDWKGTFNNNSKPLPPAPYFYRIDLDADGEIDREGWIYINY